jgi:hypothetical protein
VAQQHVPSINSKEQLSRPLAPPRSLPQAESKRLFVRAGNQHFPLFKASPRAMRNSHSRSRNSVFAFTNQWTVRDGSTNIHPGSGRNVSMPIPNWRRVERVRYIGEIPWPRRTQKLGQPARGIAAGVANDSGEYSSTGQP